MQAAFKSSYCGIFTFLQRRPVDRSWRNTNKHLRKTLQSPTWNSLSHQRISRRCIYNLYQYSFKVRSYRDCVLLVESSLYIISCERFSLGLIWSCKNVPFFRFRFTGNVDSICTNVWRNTKCGTEILKYFFNSATNTCQPFKYYSCLGNENKFDSLEQCNEMCGQSKWKLHLWRQMYLALTKRANQEKRP